MYSSILRSRSVTASRIEASVTKLSDLVGHESRVFLRFTIEIRMPMRVFADRREQHLAKQVELAHEFVDPVALLPAPLAVLPGVALDRAFLVAQVLAFEHDADFFEDARQVIG